MACSDGSSAAPRSPERTGGAFVLMRLVLVRFSIRGPMSTKVRTVSGGPAYRDATWLADRERLFRMYCQPSLDAQTSRDFTVLLFFDEDTDPRLIDRLTCRERTAALLTGPGRGMREAVNAYLETRLGERADPGEAMFISTTRLDSDDAIAPGFMETLDAAIRREVPNLATRGRGYFSFPLGQKYLVAKDRYLESRWPKNAFGTLVERWSRAGIDTVFARRHARMVEGEHTTLIDDGRGYWCVVVHGGNVRNDARRGGRLTHPHFPVASMPDVVDRRGRLARLLGRS